MSLRSSWKSLRESRGFALITLAAIALLAIEAAGSVVGGELTGPAWWKQLWRSIAYSSILIAIVVRKHWWVHTVCAVAILVSLIASITLSVRHT